MASEGAASRRPPLAPPPRRRAVGDQQPPDVLTYKRRCRGTNSNSSAVNPGSDMAQMSMVGARSSNSKQEALARHWRSRRDTLEGFLQSPGVSQSSGGIQSCIREALRYNGCQPLQQLNSPVTQGNLANSQGEAQENPSGLVHGKENNGTLVPSGDGTAASLEANKAMCNNALFDILVSEKFAFLCDSLAATFHVNKPDEVIGLEKIDARMRNGDYAHNPTLFDHDIKQIWEKFEQVGREMAGLASNLSVISRASYQKQASGLSEIDVTEHKTKETSLVGVAHKVPRESTPTCDSGHSTIPKQTETSRLEGNQTCKDCGKKADSEGRIICDGCEATYHVSCLKLAIEDVPVKWYCPTCIESNVVAAKNNGSGKSHEDCNGCDWLDITKPEERPEVVSKTELADETQESAVASLEEDSEPDLSTTALSNLCKHCGTCEDEDKKFLVCGHPYCAYKFYHIRCLKESQLAMEKQKNRSCWYCPSCICRGCFRDKDDDYTVLCDGCDDAYHIYCMKPARTSIPKGQWYCTSCSLLRATGGLQKYEKLIVRSVKHVSDAKRSKVLLGDAPEK
ncbi:PHD finger protein EHD3-like [Phragmites australis]|uniref:PHD finger protein EHD3-like n=1 Tax=Phragmites australis TaxID=29695 RepID=UPI002D767F27|nr:PHD finger protein EHD3-like [Phragmites australis]